MFDTTEARERAGRFAWVMAWVALVGGQLHADTVPFPFGGKLRRIEIVEFALGQRMGQHQRPEGQRREQA